MEIMIGVTINKDLNLFKNKCVKNGFLVLSAKDKIRLLPCLNITKKVIDKGLKIFKKTLKEIEADNND